jgi:D-sedoheptulose 7-phosphate isomerase
MYKYFIDNLDEHAELMLALRELEGVVGQGVAALADVVKGGGKIMLCGNGGSAADCQHIAAEFTGRFVKDRRPLPAISLCTDTSALTCIGNDYSFDEIFSRQVTALGAPGDCLIAISTSGNSRNVLRAVEEANSIGLLTLGLSGHDGGVLARQCSLNIIVPSSITARIQEAHILIAHTLCGGVEQELGLSPKDNVGT